MTFPDLRISTDGWVHGPVTCSSCLHTHNSVHWTGSPRVECPYCGYMTPNPDYDTKEDYDVIH